ncbi:hypothetical protein F2P81_025271 [Scophthalmus maximus]|uniref:Uncharacterized protein n=1 Tax=Scophthalmus maximus TaxID=52904 RepID=A0A6A4RQZ6_SCOMX|nr:hypothetical protein F2P81_025271 [Scophthalmus maximus]
MAVFCRGRVLQSTTAVREAYENQADDNQQGAGNTDPQPPDSATVNDQETAQPSCSTHNAVDAAHHEPSTTRRKRFNNVKIIQPLDIVRREEELNFAEYYSRVMGMLETAAERAFQQTGRQDVVQFELRAHLLNPNITDNEALTIGESMQNIAGMSDDTEIDIPKFEA